MFLFGHLYLKLNIKRLSEVKMKIENLNIALTTEREEDAESLVQSITDVMVTAGDLSLFRKSYTHKRKKP